MNNPPSSAVQEDKNKAKPWDEDDFIEALARLEQVHNDVSSLQKNRRRANQALQLTAVRLIPRQLISPLAHPTAAAAGAGPDGVNRDFTAAVDDGAARLDRLRRGWGDARTARLFERGRAGERRDPDLAPGGGVPLFGWVQAKEERERPREEEEKAELPVWDLDGMEGLEQGLDAAQEEALLDRAAAADPAFEWKRADGAKGGGFDVRVAGAGASVAFRVARRRGFSGALAYEAECVGDAKDRLVLSRCLARRPRKGDLKFLLVRFPDDASRR